jgi:sugar lactone lactonase YvrE
MLIVNDSTLSQTNANSEARGGQAPAVNRLYKLMSMARRTHCAKPSAWLITLLVTVFSPVFSPVFNLGPGQMVMANDDARAEPQLLFRIPEHDLYPESIAHDPVSGDFFLSSMSQPRILKIHSDGSYEDFFNKNNPATAVPGLASSIGMKIDAERRSLWVCTGRFSLWSEYDSTAARTGLLQFDVDSGALTGSWMSPQLQESPYHIFNDVALGASGEVYATTTLSGSVYKIVPGSEEMMLIHQLDPESHNNGITLSPDGGLLFFTIDRRIHRMALDSGEVLPLNAPGESDLGTDGLYFHENSLITIQPRLNRVSRLYLDQDLAHVTRVETLISDHPEFVYPTTGVLVDDTLVIVATSYADSPRNESTGPQHGDVLIYQIELN